MYTPIYDVDSVHQLIEHRLCWFKYDSGNLELADTWYESDSANLRSPMFADMVRKGKYGIVVEE